MGEFSSSKTTSSSEEQRRLASKMWARACMFCSLRLTRDFQSEPLCMKSAEWFWQGWVWSAACAVCLLFFSALQEKHAADLCELLQKHRGVGGNSIPSGCSGRLSPIVSAGPTLSSFSWLKYWPKFWSQGNDSCWLNMSYIFLFAILWLHSLLVMSQVKSKSLVSAEESAAPWWFNGPGQPNSSAVVAFKKKKNFWFLLYNSLFPPTSLFLSRRPQISIETYCCLVQQLCSHILHITGGLIMKPDR